MRTLEMRRCKHRVAAFRFWKGFVLSAMARASKMPADAHASAESAWFLYR